MEANGSSQAMAQARWVKELKQKHLKSEIETSENLWVAVVWWPRSESSEVWSEMGVSLEALPENDLQKLFQRLGPKSRFGSRHLEKNDLRGARVP